MAFSFKETSYSPAATRALEAANQWRENSENDEISCVALLLGLLDEPEYRAAQFLYEFEIDANQIQKVFQIDRLEKKSEQQDPPTKLFFSQEVNEIIYQAKSLLNDLPDAQEIATEHLLYGLLVSPNVASEWLVEPRCKD